MWLLPCEGADHSDTSLTTQLVAIPLQALAMRAARSGLPTVPVLFHCLYSGSCSSASPALLNRSSTLRCGAPKLGSAMESGTAPDVLL